MNEPERLARPFAKPRPLLLHQAVGVTIDPTLSLAEINMTVILSGKKVRERSRQESRRGLKKP